MLKTRLVTAAILIFLVVYVFSFSPSSWFYFLFVVLAFITMLIAATEFIAIRWNIMDGPSFVELAKPKLTLTHYAIGFSYAFPMLIYAYCWSSSSLYLKQRVYLILVAWLFFSLLSVTMYIYRSADSIQTAAHKLINFMGGFLYIAVPSICAIKMVEFPSSIRSAYLYFVLAIIHMGDAGGYFVGTKFGKHKLVPKISPKKSVEGALGGLFFSACTAVFVKYLFDLPFSALFAVFTGIILGLAGQIGDLMESAFKRAGGFKDSGHILPGHGGVLDRIDSLFLGIPVAFVLIAFVL